MGLITPPNYSMLKLFVICCATPIIVFILLQTTIKIEDRFGFPAAMVCIGPQIFVAIVAVYFLAMIF